MIFLNFHAAPIATTGTTADGYHRIRMDGGDIHLTIDTDTARQWAGVLSTITEEETK